MHYAHIFKAGTRWQLVISDTPNIQRAETEGYYPTKAAAAARAKVLNAKPWNY